MMRAMLFVFLGLLAFAGDANEEVLQNLDLFLNMDVVENKDLLEFADVDVDVESQDSAGDTGAPDAGLIEGKEQ